MANFILGGSNITADSDCSHEIKRHLLLRIKVMTNLHSILKSRNITSPTRIEVVKGMFFSSHVWIWELDHKEDWALKNWCLWIVPVEKNLEIPFGQQGDQPVSPKGNQPWLFNGKTDAEAEAPILWPPAAKSWLTGKDSDAEKDWRQEEKGMTEDKMVG